MATVDAHNNTILANITNPSSVYLPYRFVLYRHSQTDTTVPAEHKYNAVLITTKRVRVQGHPYVWEMNLCESPIELLSEGVLLPHSENDLWLNETSHKIVIKRSSHNPNKNGKYFVTEISYGGAYILMGPNGDRIPVMNMTRNCLCLSSTFKKLDQPEYERWRVKVQPFMPILSPNLLHRHQRVLERTRPLFQEWDPEPVQDPSPPIRILTPRPREAPRPTVEVTPWPTTLPRTSSHSPITTPATNTMPQHIVNAYIDTLIGRGDTCPISMNPLTREEACLTPCGHAVSRHEATRWIQDANSCPVCRAGCTVEALQSWRQ